MIALCQRSASYFTATRNYACVLKLLRIKGAAYDIHCVKMKAGGEHWRGPHEDLISEICFRSDDKIPMSDTSDVRTDTVGQHTSSLSGGWQHNLEAKYIFNQ